VHAIDEGHEDDDPRAASVAFHTAEAEEHAALVLLEDAHAQSQAAKGHERDCDKDVHEDHGNAFRRSVPSPRYAARRPLIAASAEIASARPATTSPVW
jgi:hypothetical protein